MERAPGIHPKYRFTVDGEPRVPSSIPGLLLPSERPEGVTVCALPYPDKKHIGGDPRFHALLKKIGDLHDKKQQDYGAPGDPFANVRSSAEAGVKPWVGALIRLNDKVHRLQQFAKKGTLANESAEDSFMDIAVYALIGLVLYQEEGKW
jgi:hypothetical protein